MCYRTIQNWVNSTWKQIQSLNTDIEINLIVFTFVCNKMSDASHIVFR